jgi:L,D-transpeptidase catalytic domain
MALVGPKKRPKDFGFGKGDYHLVVNDEAETMKGFDHAGKLLFTLPCLARGIYGDREWRIPESDTPPGLYRVGQVYRDYDNPNATPQHVKQSFGWYSLDLEELEGQESNVGRAGCMLHGGGSACGWTGAWAAYQQLYCTHGCVRMHNADIKNKVLPLVDGGGRVYVSVYQEA